MMSTHYKQDYIVTWTDQTHISGFQEGFTIQDLVKWYGKNDFERISSIYTFWNGSCPPGSKRTVIKIEKVARTVIFKT